MIICFLLVVCVLLLRRSRVGFCNRQHYKISSRAPGQSQIKASVPDPPQTRLSVCLETSELMNNWMPFFPTNYFSRYFLYSKGSRQDWKKIISVKFRLLMNWLFFLNCGDSILLLHKFESVCFMYLLKPNINHYS